MSIKGQTGLVNHNKVAMRIWNITTKLFTCQIRLQVLTHHRCWKWRKENLYIVAVAGKMLWQQKGSVTIQLGLLSFDSAQGATKKFNNKHFKTINSSGWGGFILNSHTLSWAACSRHRNNKLSMRFFETKSFHELSIQYH